MSPAQRRAMILGVRLHRVNTARAARAALLPDLAEFTPAGQAALIMGLAIMDDQRRSLTDLLRCELERTAQ